MALGYGQRKAIARALAYLEEVGQRVRAYGPAPTPAEVSHASAMIGNTRSLLQDIMRDEETRDLRASFENHGNGAWRFRDAEEEIMVQRMSGPDLRRLLPSGSTTTTAGYAIMCGGRYRACAFNLHDALQRAVELAKERRGNGPDQR